jgi:hypothetical protein
VSAGGCGFAAAPLTRRLPPQLSTLALWGVDLSRFLSHEDTGGYKPVPLVFDGDVGFAGVCASTARARSAHCSHATSAPNAELLRRVSMLLPEGTLRLSVDITDVQRPPAGTPRGSAPVVIKYAQSGKPHTVRCGALVNTAPQALQNLAYLRPDVEETALFKPVYYSRYFSTALMVTPKPEPGVYGFMDPPSSTSIFNRAKGPAIPWLSALFDPSPYHGEVRVRAACSAGKLCRACWRRTDALLARSCIFHAGYELHDDQCGRVQPPAGRAA